MYCKTHYQPRGDIVLQDSSSFTVCEEVYVENFNVSSDLMSFILSC